MNKLKKYFYKLFFDKYHLFWRLDSHWLLRNSNYIDRKIIHKRPYEIKQLEYLINQAEKNEISVFIDIGANFGLYSILFSKLDCIKKIYAFEPQRENFFQLCSHVLLNDKDRKIKPFQVGLSSIKGEHTFLERTKSSGMSRIEASSPASTKKNGYSKSSILVEPLDDLINLGTTEKLAIKIDVEGHELEVLQGARLLLSSNPVIIQIEILENIETILSDIERNYGLKLLHSIDCDFYLINHLFRSDLENNNKALRV